MNNGLLTEAAGLISRVRQSKPLIHQITNYVTVNDCANVTLAIGASPVMADDADEVAEIVAISSALVLNMGTLNNRVVEAMIAAGQKANESGVPVVLDPVGAGASQLRNRTARTLLERIQFSVIRGNISEIKCLAGANANTRGVDASETDAAGGPEGGVGIARLLARQYNCVVAITGETDIVSDGVRTLCIQNGHKALGSITGTGCMCSALIGSFCGAGSDDLVAAAAGVMSMGIAGEIAFEQAGHKGLGSYRVALIDQIGNLGGETICARGKLYEPEY
ncbi:Hydroxyethylthiazole kinase [Paenibacillus sp. CECT 9249]|uniref:hydroxyethylthiazole kinase n=1 Tax=Paenibacillus sp. CECT 9249 TaxID=2845385 RepID=UPI001E647ED4|nr:hydroxyethylthiazole kinase [Paenibacillus sp. CECT 9249]CAH0122172.1 Hydroxyethylthiazole kinase [Paenibacillus sp. CECT 9249]